MRRFVLLLTLLLAIPQWASAQTPVSLSSTTCPGAGCVSIGVSSQGGVGVQVTGTFSGTLTFYGSVDGTTFIALPMTPIAGGTAVTTATGWSYNSMTWPRLPTKA